MLHVGTVIYPQNSMLREALEELSIRGGFGEEKVLERLTKEVGIAYGKGSRV
jgi:hypothetical protein